MAQPARTGRDRRAVRTGLADQVSEHLLGDITEGLYPPGSRLPPEPVLADEAGVSRLTLREAVKSLAQRGILRVEQGRGTFVNPVSQWLPFDPQLLASMVRQDQDVALQLTEVRSIVEVGAASLAAKRRTATGLTDMRESIQRMKDAQSDHDKVAFSEADLQFHLAVLRAVGNDFVPALLVPVDAGLREIRVNTSQDWDMNDRAILMHEKIYDAIRRRSARAAADLMGRHLEETRKHMAGLASQARS